MLVATDCSRNEGYHKPGNSCSRVKRSRNIRFSGNTVVPHVLVELVGLHTHDSGAKSNDHTPEESDEES